MPPIDGNVRGGWRDGKVRRHGRKEEQRERGRGFAHPPLGGVRSNRTDEFGSGVVIALFGNKKLGSHAS